MEIMKDYVNALNEVNGNYKCGHSGVNINYKLKLSLVGVKTERSKKMSKGIKIDKQALIDIMLEINEYDDPDYSFDVAIWDTGAVERGDLNIDCNSRTNWHEKPLYCLTIKPAYTSEDIVNDENFHYEDFDDVDDETLAAWKNCAEVSIARYVDWIAEAIERGDSIDDIYFEMRW